MTGPTTLSSPNTSWNDRPAGGRIRVTRYQLVRRRRPNERSAGVAKAVPADTHNILSRTARSQPGDPRTRSRIGVPAPSAPAVPDQLVPPQAYHPATDLVTLVGCLMRVDLLRSHRRDGHPVQRDSFVEPGRKDSVSAQCPTTTLDETDALRQTTPYGASCSPEWDPISPPGVRRTSPQTRQDQDRNHPLLEALRRPGGLPSPPLDRRLTPRPRGRPDSRFGCRHALTYDRSVGRPRALPP
jgi:hypothetical protein